MNDSGRTAELTAIQSLEKKYGQGSGHRTLRVGRVNHEFDFVSDATKVVAEVKVFEKRYEDSTQAQLKTRRERCIVDCAWLNAVSGPDTKIFVLRDDYVNNFAPVLRSLFPKVQIVSHQAVNA